MLKPNPKLSRIPVALAVLALAVVAVQCGDPNADRPHLLLVSVDTTRADSLGCYGQTRIDTPRIDALAAEGVLFEQCTTSVPVTLPSHASLLTGTEPFVHGVRNNGMPVPRQGLVTLAETLAEAGYATGAFVSAFVLDAQFGLDRGFDTYDDDFGRRAGGAARGPAPPAFERRADATCDAALAWLRDRSDERFFLWLHLFDPHDPYEPPEPYRSRYEDPYLAEVAYVDEQIGRVLDELERLKLAEDTLVVLVGDHGEGRGDHGEETHTCLLYDSTLRVPFLMRAPGRLPARLRVAKQVSTLDVVPTVLALLDLDAPTGRADLLPLVRGEAMPGITAYSETMIPRFDMSFSHLRSLRIDGWKYIHAPKPELYDVLADPGEERNLAGENPELVERMRERLRSMLADAQPVGAEGDGADAATRQRLMAMGYMGGSGEGGAGEEIDLFEPVGEDPKDHVREINLVKAGFELMRVGRLDEACARFVEAGEVYPTWPVAPKLAAMTFSMRGMLDEAIPLLEEAVRLGPRDLETRSQLGMMYERRQRPEDALRCHREIVAADPHHAGARTWLARESMRRGAFAEAEEHCRQAHEAHPANPGVLQLLAWILATAPDDAVRDGEEALALAERACEVTGNRDSMALLSLAAALAETGDFEAAVEKATAAEREARGRQSGALIQRCQMLRDRYFRAGRPYRESGR